jgi:predicted MFS family arabinose efflux permease
MEYESGWMVGRLVGWRYKDAFVEVVTLVFGCMTMATAVKACQKNSEKQYHCSQYRVAMESVV